MATASLVALAAWALGCSPRAEPPPVPLDCSSQSAYQTETQFMAGGMTYSYLENYDGGFGWYQYGDPTPGAVASIAGVPIEGDGGPCGASPYALLLQSHGFQDYGSGFGTYTIGGWNGIQRPGGIPCYDPDGGPDGGYNCPLDASGWEGIRFWARSYDPSGAPTTKGVTLTLNDKDTISNVEGHDCRDYDAGVQGNGQSTYSAIGGGAGPAGGSVTSALPPADACGNGFSQVLLTTDQWHLYLLPFSSFHQLARPNRVPTGFDPASFAQITIVVPKEAALSLWIDDISFYRPWPPGAGVEAGQ